MTWWERMISSAVRPGRRRKAIFRRMQSIWSWKRPGWKAEDVSYLFAGDLLGQCIATSFGISAYNIPLFGVYGACSTCGEALTLGAVMGTGGYAEHVVCVTSSHFASAEKEFRFR